jgi:hypothetical protein
MKASKFFVLIALALTGSVNLFAQDLVLNVTNAPIELIQKGHTLSVRNRSNQTIVSYGLGCARLERKLIKVTLRLKIEKNEIPAATAISSASFDLLPEELRTCQDLKSRLVPLRVIYKNGQTWSLSTGSVLSTIFPEWILHARSRTVHPTVTAATS